MTPEEKTLMVRTIKMRERELEVERKSMSLLREEFSYEVRIAMKDRLQLKGGSDNQQAARLMASKRNNSGGFFIGMDSATAPQAVSEGRINTFREEQKGLSTGTLS
mmetsp:Transcript_15191/g.36793  ORF Transcript_15191/g.36793 Transcript_15191/m.36793 type:complete len:106 (+) Transcript_15191:252-569(+)|eukprot:CAMPEP_0197577272 /NCGR_PEP_ID=MMETSP1326-20131121/1969_1 /TAXON_ID=1155430 /ORGANISM="Genus nov. species nov., Strain RCC2288" /LENGTH=105 /DNA_ID=CAMNT_0043140323 /DNA_START=232 /DNA_END=549 /DNA_ORIENTATION=-